MKIVLDSNIICSDYLMTGSKFQMLFDFAGKTENIIYVPQIAYEEILGKYRRKLTEDFLKIDTQQNHLQRILVDPGLNNTSEDEIEQYIDKYKQHLAEIMALNQIRSIQNSNDYLPEVVHRAVNQIHPFTKHRKEFRDVLIWLAVLDLAEGSDEKEVTIISLNSTDFSDNENQLHPDLQAEASKRGLSINLVSSLGKFLEQHATKIEFITKEWIEANTIQEEITDKIRAYIFEIESDDMVGNLRGHGFDFYGIFDAQIQDLELDCFYVYEMQDGSLRLEAEYCGVCDIEFETYHINNEELSPEFWCNFSYTVKNKEITDTEIVEFSTNL